MMTAKELAEKMTDIAKNYKTTYVWGGIGQPVTDASIKAHIAQYPKNTQFEASARKLIGKNAFAFDCCGVIKSVLWGFNGDKSKFIGGATYQSNGVPDINDGQMIAKCSGVSTDFSNIQVGELLWCSGHVGIYIGNGLGVECTPKWSGDVQITAVGNIGAKSGYNTRFWTKHGKLPYVTYSSTTSSSASKPSTSTSSTNTSSTKKKPDYAQSFNKSYVRTYTVNTALLNMRYGAGITKGVIRILKKGQKLNCYGYYTQNGSTTWLYVLDQKSGAEGFVSKKYLSSHTSSAEGNVSKHFK